MVLTDFDFSILNEDNFLEDSVREEILTPILHGLGYKVSGSHKILRSKPLTHPFVYIGTIKRKINIIPDYILQINDKPTLIIDAKSPKEDIEKGKNVEQAFSYAIHKEIRVQGYGLCNGKKLTLFKTSNYHPFKIFDLTRISDCWHEIERFLKPEFIERPYLFGFIPDLGMSLEFLSDDKKVFLPNSLIKMIIKLSDNDYSINCIHTFEGNDFLVTFDMNKETLDKILSLMPPVYKKEINQALSFRPFQANIRDGIDIALSVTAKPKTIIKSTMTSEEYIPFEILKIHKLGVNHL